MLSPKDISALLAELYASDPSLKAREVELKRLIASLAASKPDIKPDAAFIASLRKELAKKAKALSTPSASLSSRHRFWPTLAFASSGAAICLMAVLFVTQNATIQRLSSGAARVFDALPSGSYQALVIDRVGDNAFGSLALALTGSENGMERDSAAPALNAVGMGGESGSGASRSFGTKTASSIAAPQAVVEMDEASEDASAPSPVDTKMMPYRPQAEIAYSYTGDPLTLNQGTADVYRRKTGGMPSDMVSSVLRGMNLGAVNLSTFGGASVSDLSLIQDQPFGYMVYVSFKNGSVNIDQNWERWQDAYPTCQDDACWERTRLKPSDVPSDEDIVRIADDFLQEHGIDRSPYGNGIVQHQEDRVYALSSEAIAYVPDGLSVVYPLKIGDGTVYGTGGSPSGLSVTINLRARRVSNVYGIQAVHLQASSYELETDVEAILKYAKAGGIGGRAWMAAEEGQEAQGVALGTPWQGYVQTYVQDGNQSVEMYVPALFFPVTSAPSGMEWLKNSPVIVPLVKGLPTGSPMIRPFIEPAMMKSGGAGVSGSSGGMAVPDIEIVEPVPAPAIDLER